MSAILDILIVVIITLTIFFAAKNGFVKTLLSGTGFLIAVVIAFLCVGTVKQYFVESSLAKNAKESLNQTLAGFVESSTEGYDPTELIENPQFVTLINVFGIDEDEFMAKWEEWRTENTELVRDKLVEYVSEPIVDAVATVISFLVLLFGVWIILKILTYVLDKVFTLPVLKQANTFLGVILGIALAALRVYLFCAVVNFIIPFGTNLGWGFLTNIKPDDTLLFRWFCQNNIFAAFFG